MSIFPPAPKPKSLLGYHRILAPVAGVRVSPLCLGAMNFGEAWKDFLGECDKKTAFEMLDYFYENGGNFIDTANNYQAGESETWIGEWIAARKNRDEMVIATKYTTYFPTGEVGIRANYQGQHAKSLRLSLAASLKKLQTTYIDLLYIHCKSPPTLDLRANLIHNQGGTLALRSPRSCNLCTISSRQVKSSIWASVTLPPGS